MCTCTEVLKMLQTGTCMREECTHKYMYEGRGYTCVHKEESTHMHYICMKEEGTHMCT